LSAYNYKLIHVPFPTAVIKNSQKVFKSRSIIVGGELIENLSTPNGKVAKWFYFFAFLQQLLFSRGKIDFSRGATAINTWLSGICATSLVEVWRLLKTSLLTKVMDLDSAAPISQDKDLDNEASTP